jgi:hypothetical protein
MHEMTDYQVLDRETESRFGEDPLTNVYTHRRELHTHVNERSYPPSFALPH